MNRLIALTALLTVCVGQTAAQCGSSCAPAFGPTARLLEGWHPSQQWPGWQLCYVRGVVVAGYRQETDAYCTYDAAANRWSQVTAPPWGSRAEKKQNFGVDESKLGRPSGAGDVRRAADGLAASAASAKALVDELVELYEAKTVQNFGVDSARLAHGDDRYLINGRQVTREDALRAVGSSNLADDSHKPRLTVIGSEADRQRVLADFEAAPLAEWRPKLVLHAYAPDHWHVAKAGFKTDGKPTIYLQRADGVVMHRQDDYSGGAPVLAQAIRKADPNYDPAKDPNANKPTPAPGAPDWINGLLAKLPVPPWVAAAAIAAAGLYYFRDKLPKAHSALAESFEKAQSTRQQPVHSERPVAQYQAAPRPPIPSRPEITVPLGRQFELLVAQEEAEEAAIKQRAEQRERERQAMLRYLKLNVPAPNQAPATAEPEKKG
jgi:hypothetical protein